MPRLLKVEEASRMAGMHWGQTRRKLGLRSSQLTPEKMLEIMRVFAPPPGIRNPIQKFAAHYELGHRFVVEHLVGALRRKTGLSKKEEGLVRGSLGRVHYNPPMREFEARAEAASELHAIPERNEKLFGQLKTSLLELIKLHTDEAMRRKTSVPFAVRDLFANPLNSLQLAFDKASDFSGLAAFYLKHEPTTPAYG